MVGRWCRLSPSHRSGCLRFVGLRPTSSHACCTPWSVFQDGQIGSLPPASRGRSSRRTRRAPFGSSSGGAAWDGFDASRACPARPLDADQHPAHAAGRRAGVSLGAPGASDPFPLNNFKYFLTLFSKFFSSFPHGTCSLSVSRRYSAFDGIYHRLWAAFPSNPTLRKRLVEWLAAAADGVLTLSDAPFQGTWARPATEDASLDYNSPMTLIGDFQVGLFPLRSPLLGESWLVSSPPPTDMLKLSGWSCLNSGRTLGVSLLRLGHGGPVEAHGGMRL